MKPSLRVLVALYAWQEFTNLCQVVGVEEGSKDAVGEFISAAATEEIQIKETDEVDEEHELWDALQ